MKPDGHYLFPWIAAEGWQIQLLTAQTPWASSPSSPAPGHFLRYFPMKAEAAPAPPHAIRATIRAAFSAANFAFHMNDERACDSRYRGSAIILLHCGGRGGEPPGGCARRNRGIYIGRALKCDLAVRRTIAMNDIVGSNTCDNSRGSSARHLTIMQPRSTMALFGNGRYTPLLSVHANHKLNWQIAIQCSQQLRSGSAKSACIFFLGLAAI